MTLALDAAGKVALPLRVLVPGSAEAVAADLVYRLLTRRGTHRRDRTLGLPWGEWIDQMPADPAIASQVRAQARRVASLERVVAVDIERANGKASISIRYTVAALAGEQALAFAGELYETGGASAWYIVGGPFRRGSIGGTP